MLHQLVVDLPVQHLPRHRIHMLVLRKHASFDPHAPALEQDREALPGELSFRSCHSSDPQPVAGHNLPVLAQLDADLVVTW